MSQFIDIIEFLDESGRVLVQRYPEFDSGEIKMGAQLIVNESQLAFFYRDGKILDRFTPGRHTLSTANLPLLTTLLSLPYGFKSPFRAFVYIVSQKEFQNLKWGTPEPILYPDKQLQMVRLRARGTYTIRVDDPEVFLGTVVGTQGRMTTDRVEDQFRAAILSAFTDLLGTMGVSVLDLPKMYEEIGIAVAAKVRDALARNGVSLVELRVAAITLPEEVQKMIDEQTGMNTVGDMNRYMQFKAAKALETSAQHGGSGILQSSLEMGLGATMGMMLPGMMQPQAAARPLPAPPPAPAVPAVSSPPGTSALPGGAFCTACGQQNQASAKFCAHCGAKIGSGACPKCNFRNVPGAKFCNECGEKVG